MQSFKEVNLHLELVSTATSPSTLKSKAEIEGLECYNLQH